MTAFGLLCFCTCPARCRAVSGRQGLHEYKQNAGLHHSRPAFFIAEREGFEPSVQLPVQRFSRPSRSATPASFRNSTAKITFLPVNGQVLLHFFAASLKKCRKAERFLPAFVPLSGVSAGQGRVFLFVAFA